MRQLLAALFLFGATNGLPSKGARVYVANQDDATVSVIDASSHKLIKTIDLQKLGFGKNAKPHHAQVEPDGSYWYLTMIGEGKVLKFDRNDKIVGTAEMEVPGLIALSPTQDLLVVGRSMSAVNPPKRIALIRRSDMKLLEEVDIFFERPHALVIDPTGEYAYVASLGVNQLASVRLSDGKVTLVDYEGPPQSFTQFSMSPNGKWLALTSQMGNQVLIYDVTDKANPKLAQSIATEKGPFETIFTYDGGTMFVTNLDANKVSAIDVASWKVTDVIESKGFSQPHGVALSPDGKFLFVSNRHQSGGAHDHEGHKATGAGTLVTLCIPTKKEVEIIEVGHYAAGIGVAIPKTPPKTPVSCS